MTAGWMVYDLGKRSRAAGPAGEAAMTKAHQLHRLELPAATLGIEGENAPR